MSFCLSLSYFIFSLSQFTLVHWKSSRCHLMLVEIIHRLLCGRIGWLGWDDGHHCIGLSNRQVVFIRKSIHMEVFNQYLYLSFCTQEKRLPEGILSVFTFFTLKKKCHLKVWDVCVVSALRGSTDCSRPTHLSCPPPLPTPAHPGPAVFVYLYLYLY